MLNAVGGVRSIFDSAKIALEFLRKKVLFFLGMDDFRVLVSLHTLMIREPL